MANIGEPHGADRATIATLHAIRVALVVGILPLALYFLFPIEKKAFVTEILSPEALLIVLAVALFSGWLGARVNLPASWLLGALLGVAILTASGSATGQIPETLMAIAQVFVGMSLGAKFQRNRLRDLPKAMLVVVYLCWVSSQLWLCLLLSSVNSYRWMRRLWCLHFPLVV